VHFPGKHIGQVKARTANGIGQQVPHLGQKPAVDLCPLPALFSIPDYGNLPDKALVKLDGYHLGPGVSFDKSRLNTASAS
jgi:hypothetical protein